MWSHLTSKTLFIQAQAKAIEEHKNQECITKGDRIIVFGVQIWNDRKDLECSRFTVHQALGLQKFQSSLTQYNALIGGQWKPIGIW